MQPVRMAVIGLGWFGENHTQVLADMPGVELAALCTRRPERLQEFADRFHVGKTYTDYRELLADPDIDAVSIVTHVNDHRDLAVAALQAGKHVLLEKPMAGTVEDCETILKAAKAAKGIFMVGHICRFDARVNLAKQAVAAGRIGEIISMHATRNLPADLGAIVLNQISSLLGDGIHDGDIMLWLTGKPVETVYAKTIRYRDLKYPDGGWAMYTFQGGAVGVIETLWCLPVTTGFTIDARMEIIGTEGAIYIDCGNAGLTISDEKGLHKPDTAYWPEMLASRVGALRTELEYFAGCARRNQAPEVTTPEESLAAVKMIVAAELSAVTGEVVTC